MDQLARLSPDRNWLNSRWALRLTVVTAVLIAVFAANGKSAAVSATTTEQENSDSTLDRWFETWQRQESEIASCDISYRAISLGRSHLREITCIELDKLFSSVQLANDPNALYQISAGFVRESDAEKIRWQPQRFEFQGGKHREETYWDGQLVRIRVNDGDTELLAHPIKGRETTPQGNTEIVDHGERLVSIFSPGSQKEAETSVRDFRFTPRVGTLREFLSSAKVISSAPNGTTLVKFGASEIFVDTQSGFVRRCTIKSSNGAVARETVQEGCIQLPQDICFPVLIRTTRFDRNEKLQNIQLTLIDKVQVNQELTPETFKVAAAAQSPVLDYRLNTSNPESAELIENTKDVVKATDGLKLVSSPARHWISWFSINVFIVLVLLLLIAAKWYWQRRVSI